MHSYNQLAMYSNMQFQEKSKKRETNLESLLAFVAIEIGNHLGLKAQR